MIRVVVACMLLLAACANDDQPSPTETVITGACNRSFRAVLEAWELEFGRVPEPCAFLDAEYPVQVVTADELPCDRAPAGAELVGCLHDGVIYLLRGRSELELIDSSVHEWIHALAACVDGTPDELHVRGELWIDYGPDTIEAQALASVEIGKCL